MNFGVPLFDKHNLNCAKTGAVHREWRKKYPGRDRGFCKMCKAVWTLVGVCERRALL